MLKWKIQFCKCNAQLQSTLCINSLRRALVLLFFTLVANCLYALPDGPLPDAVFDRNIKSVQFQREGWEFSFPIIDLNNPAALVLSFDDLGTASRNFNYEVIYCDADWNPSRLTFTEYMDGFFQNPLYNYQPSFNTYVKYNHYEIRIPDDNLKIKLSGNYALVLFEGSNDDEPVFIKRFVAFDQKVDIDALVKRPTLPKFQNTCQEVDFSVLNPNFVINDPVQSVKVVIAKNGQWNFSIDDLKPLFVRDKELVYNYEEQNLFYGGNEYRSFDTKNLKYQDANMARIDFVNNWYEIVLVTDNERTHDPYLFRNDLNGRFLVQNQQGSDPSVDADYVNMKFSLKAPDVTENSDVYLFGEFSDFNCYDDFKMKYNETRQIYELETLMKQGYYNYQYVVKDKKSGDINDTAIEGSFYETENNYVIYVYYRPFGARNDILIGVKIVNSINVN